MRLPGTGVNVYSYGKYRLFFNILILTLSISFMFVIGFVWKELLNYEVMLSYIASTSVSFLAFYFMKVTLQKSYSSEDAEPITTTQPPGSMRQNLLLLAILLAILATPLVLLFFFYYLWIVILDGIVSGAVMSDLALYFFGKDHNE